MGDLIYKPLIEKMVWSYSRLRLFEDCPYAWFMKYIYNVEDVPNFYNSFGQFVHDIIDGFYKGNISKERLPIEYIKGFYEKVVRTGAEDETIDKYLTQTFEYFKHFEPLPYECVATEKTIFFEVAGHPFTSRIDYIGRDADGSLCIADHKARDIKPRGFRKNKPLASNKVLDKLLDQLYLYSSAVKAEYGVYPSKLCFNCYRTGVFIEEPFDEKRHDETIERIAHTISLIENETEWFPNIEWFYCKSMCGMRHECEFHMR